LKALHFSSSGIRQIVSGVLFAAGMPFAHLPGYIGGALALPSLFEKKSWEEGRSVFVPLLAFVVYCAITSLFVELPWDALHEVPDALLSWVLPFVAGLSIAHRREGLFRVYTAAWILLITGSVAAGVGLLPDKWPITIELWGEGMMWALHHHNDFAASMVIILPVLLYKSLKTRQWGWWIVTTIVLMGLVLSGSRGYYIAFVPALLGYMWKEIKTRRVRIYLLSAAMAVFVVLVLTIPGIWTRVAGMISEDQSITSRINSLRVTGWIVTEHPLIGLGPGQLVNHPEYLEKAASMGLFIDTQPGRMKHLHNVYATMAAECGLIGLALFLWALMALAVRLRRGDAMSRALFWGYIGFLVGNLFDSQLLGPSAGMDFFFLAGLFFPHLDEVSPGDSS